VGEQFPLVQLYDIQQLGHTVGDGIVEFDDLLTKRWEALF
jgi:hypothetical protein